MNAGHIQIFTAVQMETRAISRALGDRCRPHTIGIRAPRLPTVDELADKSIIILCGVAGALDPSLDIGDVVLDDPTGLVGEEIDIRRGTVFTANQIVATPADKAELFAQTHAAVVDMEQSIVRDFARRAGIPVIGLRTVSDTASDTLDPAVVSMVDNLGRPRPMHIAMNLIRRPGLIPSLRRLNASTKLALEHLAVAVKEVVDHLAQKNDCHR